MAVVQNKTYTISTSAGSNRNSTKSDKVPVVEMPEQVITSPLFDVTTTANTPGVKLNKSSISGFTKNPDDENNTFNGEVEDLSKKLDLVRKAMDRIQHSAKRSGDIDDEGDAASTSARDTPKKSATYVDTQKPNIDKTEPTGNAESRDEEDSLPTVGGLRDHAASLLERAKRLLDEPKEPLPTKNTIQKEESQIYRRDEGSTQTSAASIRDRARRLAREREEVLNPTIPACPIRDHARRLLEETTAPRFKVNRTPEAKEDTVSIERSRSSNEEDVDFSADHIRLHAQRLLDELSDDMKRLDELADGLKEDNDIAGEEIEEEKTMEDPKEESKRKNEMVAASTAFHEKSKRRLPSLLEVFGFVFYMLRIAARVLMRVFTVLLLLSTATCECMRILALNGDAAKSRQDDKGTCPKLPPNTASS